MARSRRMPATEFWQAHSASPSHRVTSHNHPPLELERVARLLVAGFLGVVWRPSYGDTTSLDCRDPQATSDGIRFSSVSGVSRERIKSSPRSATGCQDDVCGCADTGRLIGQDEAPEPVHRAND
jgi:hypothetical protein